MFKFVVVCALLVSAFAQHHGRGAVQSHGNSDDVHAEIKYHEADVHEKGFRYAFETTNNIKTVAEGDENGNHRGDFQWISPEGEHIEVSYDADENGYQPKSNVLPTPHPIPEPILKALKYIEEHPHYEEHPQVGHAGRRF